MIVSPQLFALREVGTFLKGETKVNTIGVYFKRILFALIIATQILLAASVSHAQPYQPISTENSIVGDDLSRTETTIQSGNNTLNRFG